MQWLRSMGSALFGGSAGKPVASIDPELVNPLLSVLDDIVALLEEYDEAHWAALMQESRDLVAHGGKKGLQSLFSRYGGMGSFNDLIVAQHLSGEAMIAPNNRLDALRSQAYDLALEARQSLDR